MGDFPATMEYARAVTDRTGRPLFTVRLVALAAFLFPLWYIGLIAAVVLHEIIGHGCTSKALGGTFTGFMVNPDGMGWAEVECEGHWFAVAAGGIIATTAAGIALLLVAVVLKNRPMTRLALLAFAFTCFNDGLPYGFWNAVYPDPSGDVGEILKRLDAGWPGLRWGLVIGLGAAYAAANLAVLWMMWRLLEDVLGRLGLGRAIVVSLALVAGPGVAYWLSFDWNQLIEGIGGLPIVVGISLHLAVAVLVVLSLRREVMPVSVGGRQWLMSIAVTWLVCAAVIIVVLIWLRHGVTL